MKTSLTSHMQSITRPCQLLSNPGHASIPFPFHISRPHNISLRLPPIYTHQVGRPSLANILLYKLPTAPVQAVIASFEEKVQMLQQGTKGFLELTLSPPSNLISTAYFSAGKRKGTGKRKEIHLTFTDRKKKAFIKKISAICKKWAQV